MKHIYQVYDRRLLNLLLHRGRSPKRVMSGELENAGKRGPGGKEKEWTDCVADDLRLFGITRDWSAAALDPGVWYTAQYTKGVQRKNRTHLDLLSIPRLGRKKCQNV